MNLIEKILFVSRQLQQLRAITINLINARRRKGLIKTKFFVTQ
ncbi:MAG: hypothetical protein N2053_02775 [Chitinispirillaceae bacterium]|nr:hypothetical protein [Chitinispirillaceae bacterium]